MISIISVIIERTIKIILTYIFRVKILHDNTGIIFYFFQLFSDLYLGNSPRSHPRAQGIITTATGLPPRPRRQMSNEAAARLRRHQNERRKDNFSLEGSSFKDVTLRDLL